MSAMRRPDLIALVLLVCCAPLRAQQAYPTKPIRIVVPYAAGGSVDPMARLVADRLSKTIGQSVVIENRPGAGGNIGIEAVVRGAHDGYTLLATPSAVAINPSLYAKVPYDLEKDLVPVALINRNAMIILVNPVVGREEPRRSRAHARKPGADELRASPAMARSIIWCARHLRASAGLDMVKINYHGVPKAITALIAGEVQLMVASATAALPYVKSGQLQAIAVTSAERSRASAGRADHARARLHGFRDVRVDHAVRAGRRAARHRSSKLHDDIAKVVAQPDVTKIIADIGSEAQALSLDELKTYVRQEAALFAGIVKSSGARVD